MVEEEKKGRRRGRRRRGRRRRRLWKEGYVVQNVHSKCNVKNISIKIIFGASCTHTFPCSVVLGMFFCISLVSFLIDGVKHTLCECW